MIDPIRNISHTPPTNHDAVSPLLSETTDLPLLKQDNIPKRVSLLATITKAEPYMVTKIGKKILAVLKNTIVFVGTLAINIPLTTLSFLLRAASAILAMVIGIVVALPAALLNLPRLATGSKEYGESVEFTIAYAGIVASTLFAAMSASLMTLAASATSVLTAKSLDEFTILFKEQLVDLVKFGKDYIEPTGLSDAIEPDLTGEASEYAEAVKSAAVFGGFMVLSPFLAIAKTAKYIRSAL